MNMQLSASRNKAALFFDPKGAGEQKLIPAIAMEGEQAQPAVRSPAPLVGGGEDGTPGRSDPNSAFRRKEGIAQNIKKKL